MVSLLDSSLKKWQDNDAEHLRYEYENVKHCIDIGSYRNEWADEMKRKFNCSVECFEALDNRAAWTYDGELEIGGVFLYSSIFTNEGKRKVKCEDIAKYLDREVSVMKINIEGGEYELLSYIIYKGLHKNIKNIQVQFHKVDEFDCEDKERAICRQLMKTHELTFKYQFCWENWKLK